MLALLVATELFYFLPKSVLASIIIIAVAPLIDFKVGCSHRKMKRAHVKMYISEIKYL